MSENQVTNFLTIGLFCMLGLLLILCVIYVIFRVKENKRQHSKPDAIQKNSKQQKNEQQEKEYNKQSIFSFMKFDRIQDDMIVRQNGKRYLMVVECQGVNYDLMSGVEKVSVEQGFIQFLNTLRHPIQIYTQTRTVNLGKSIVKYKERLKKVEDRLISKQLEYNSKVGSNQYTRRRIK